MKPKKKTMRRDEWTRITKKRYVSKDYDDYVIGLIIMDEVNETLTVENDYETIKIMDNNYKWLSIAPKGENYFVTAMYDNQDKLIEIYFDINNGNNFDDITNPYFYDMYLDLYITNKENIGYLDFEELDNALNNSEITKDEYNLAKISFEKLSSKLTNHEKDMINFCNKKFEELKAEM